MRRRTGNRVTRRLVILRVTAISLGIAWGGGAGFAADAPPAAARAVPGFELEAQEIDLGTIARGDTAEAVFRLRNTGDRELRILEAKPG